MTKRIFTVAMVFLLMGIHTFAQLAKDNKSKFLGNITTSYNWVEYCDISECNITYSNYWNQVTCENATKWGSVHSGWGTFSWTNADRTYNYCKEHGILFKFHALIWGSQHPTWIESLSVEDTKKAIIEWYDEVKNHYPDLEIIDVVNEAIYSGSDYHSPYKSTKIIEALGSLAEDRLGQTFNCNTNGYSSTNSYQWIAEAFRLARERWPNAILIYNDYNTFQWQKTEYINLINGLKACNAPIDAAGCQSHDLNDMSGSDFKTALYDIHDKIDLPIYITEYDIAKSDDATQLTRYKEQFPVMWEADFVPGVTLWGWVYGKTWTTDGNSGLVKDCSDRSAFTWLKEYMASDAAKNATAPSMGSKGVTATLSLSAESMEVGDELTITVEAESQSSTVSHIDMFANDSLLVNKYIAPYVWTYTPTQAGTVTIKIVAYDEDGNTAEQAKNIVVCDARAPYSGVAIELPGTIELEDFDKGCDGVSYHDSDDENEGGEYRTDCGVDIVTGNGGYALGYTASGEWLEYTVNVTKEDVYKWTATVASGSTSSAFSIYMGETNLTGKVSVPQTAENDWSVYEEISGETSVALPQGTYTLRLNIEGSYCNLDKVTFEATTEEQGTRVQEVAQEGALNGICEVYSTLGVHLGQVSVMDGDLSDLHQQFGQGVFVVRNLKNDRSKLILVK